MGKDQKNSPQRRKILSILIGLGCGCIFLCLPAGFITLKLAVAGLFAGGESTGPAWSPDGKSIAFASSRAGLYDIYIMNRDGSQVRRLTNSRAEGKEGNADPDWSPDGQQILFTSQEGSYAYGLPEDGGPLPTADIHRIDVDGTNLTRLTDLAGYIQSPVWSPDGSCLVFVSGDIYHNAFMS